jgi:hypothetical protein
MAAAALLLPALLAGAAAVALALGPAARPGRLLAAAAAVGALGLALLGPAGPLGARWLLLGSLTGLDGAGRAALLVLAAALGLGLRGARGEAAGRGLGWTALLGAGLATTAVAFDAGTLALGFVLLVSGAYGLAARRSPEGVRGAAIFLGLAVVAEVLLVDGLAEFGHAAQSAHLDAMRRAAERELGGKATLLLAAAYGLPLALAGIGGTPVPLFALAAAAVVAVLRLLPGPGRPAEEALALFQVAAFGAAAAGAARALWRWRPRAPSGPAPDRGAPPDRRPPPILERPAVRTALRLLERAERGLGAFTASGLLLALLVLVLLVALLLAR